MTTTPMNEQLLERIAAALERIADNLYAAKVLEERRAKDRSRKRVSAESPRKERNEEGKEENPPCTPLKEKGEEEKKELPSPRAHARGFVPPTVDEVTAYCRERRSPVDPVAFWNFYASKGWMIGRNRMKNWRCAVVTWERDANRQPFRGTAPLDPKAAAFERQRAEAEDRKRRAISVLDRIEKGGAQ